ncbi:uncharacterized protein LOC112028355 isoform X1 [Quercus suber]|uniref:WRC domain-containing protein n=1 Tax=Quercus suber TaxID=58331 RepID=A0AAW0J1J9_QUESU|nr:uncharacterized protein LOC112028355 [Quercus suber]POF05175.1 hypothetical protein CFP56_05775 [Quercus suber]
MRIRKRQVPFPFSSLSPVPLSDPLLNRSPVVQLQLHNTTQPKASHPLENLSPQSDRYVHFGPQPSDQPANQRLPPIRGGSNGLDFSDDVASGPHNEVKKKDCLELFLQGKDERGGVEEKGNDTRMGGILGAETVTGLLSESSASRQASGRWCEGERAFPPKKRRGTFERRAGNDEDAIMEKDKKMKTKMKTKMNKKCAAQQNDNNKEEEGEEGEEKETKDGVDNVSNGSSNIAKKRARGGALMEGSRCSRVNGRGWRCMQKTLVGYSLCEHHLGKGRLRSMTSVRSRSLASTTTAPKLDNSNSTSNSDPPATLSTSFEDNKQKDIMLDNDIAGAEDEKKPSVSVTKKRMKLGMVKARSISSLLGQTNNGNNVVLDNNN